VIAAIEDGDVPARWQVRHRAPEEVVRDLDRGWRLERRDVQAARIDVRKDVPDRAVFASRVERLEDDQHRVAPARIELLLPVADLERRLRELRFPLLVVLVLFGRRRAVADPEFTFERYEETMSARFEHRRAPWKSN